MSAVRSRGHDWANAGARLGIALSVPAAASVLHKLFGTDHPDSPWLLLLWLGGVWLGIAWAWEAWQVALAGPTVRVSGGRITGRTRWPLRRPRSARLDAPARVRYLKRSFGERWITHYLVVRDQHGAQVAVESRGRRPAHRRLCRMLLEALSRTPDAKASRLSSRRLAGSPQWWLLPLWGLGYITYVFTVVMIAIWITFLLGGMPE